jgi:exopolysaccharide biosynthesis protein
MGKIKQKRAINVENALQMDGGGSTSLYIANNNVLSYKTLRKSVINFAIIDE